MPAIDMHFRADEIARLDGAHLVSHALHNPAKLVPQCQRRLNASLRPAVPAINVQVCPANRSRLHAHQHIRRPSRRHCDRIHLQALRRLHLPQRLHRRRHLLRSSFLVQRANPDASTPFLGLSIVPLCMPSLCSVGASAPTAFSLQTFNLQTFNGLASPAPLPRSSSAPSNTPPPSPLAPAHTPPKLHLQSAAHSVSHPQNSAPHTHTLPPLPTVPHNSVASASPLPPPLRDPQNSRTQTPPAGPSVLSSASTSCPNLLTATLFSTIFLSAAGFPAIAHDSIPYFANSPARSRMAGSSLLLRSHGQQKAV